MKSLQHFVTNIDPGIDRIKFSIPISYCEELLANIEMIGTPLPQEPRLKNRYKKYDIPGSEIIVDDQRYSSTSHFYDRILVTIYDPSTEAMECLKSIFTFISRHKQNRFDEVMISQVEVSYDFFTKSDDDIESIKQFMDYHVALRYARTGSYEMIYDTQYIGPKGKIRRGKRGSRMYPKEEHGKSFFRFEMQYNRPYLRDNNITIEDLPLNPLSFQTFDHVLLLENLSSRGVKNISRSILKKEKIIESSCPDFNKRHFQTQNKVRLMVLGDIKGSKHTISEQIDAMKDLIKDKKLKINPLEYFPSLDLEKELILFHAHFGYEELNCSKRMVFCQSA